MKPEDTEPDWSTKLSQLMVFFLFLLLITVPYSPIHPSLTFFESTYGSIEEYGTQELATFVETGSYPLSEIPWLMVFTDEILFFFLIYIVGTLIVGWSYVLAGKSISAWAEVGVVLLGLIYSLSASFYTITPMYELLIFATLGLGGFFLSSVVLWLGYNIVTLCFTHRDSFIPIPEYVSLGYSTILLGTIIFLFHWL